LFTILIICIPFTARAEDGDLIGDLIEDEIEQAAPVVGGPVIIIDPGHGGKDTGAIGKNGAREKDVVLQISQKLAAELQDRLKARVVMTRTRDDFITLDARDQIAIRERADVFLSIHANAAARKEAQGIEVYYLNNATDEAANRLAARENKGSQKSLSDLQNILSTMIQTESTELSRLLAEKIQTSLKKRIASDYGLNRVAIKSALFYVLVGSKAPSILLEVGFVTNPEEARRLQQHDYQERLANSVANGVADYLDVLKSRKVNL
jgi:N-acetylmuramoyl-L-alanine amidase